MYGSDEGDSQPGEGCHREEARINGLEMANYFQAMHSHLCGCRPCHCLSCVSRSIESDLEECCQENVSSVDDGLDHALAPTESIEIERRRIRMRL
jgi:hypothetical protein